MITFPILRSLMAKYGLTYEKMGQLIGNTYVTFGKKINGQSEFGFNDMEIVTNYFRDKGEEVTVDYIFFDWKFAKTNNSATGS